MNRSIIIGFDPDEDGGDYKILSPAEVLSQLSDPQVVIVDVRTPREYQSHHIPGSLLLPLPQLSTRWQELDPSRRLICICEHGVRSEMAASFLASRGLPDVATMRGGLVCWSGAKAHGSGFSE